MIFHKFRLLACIFLFLWVRTPETKTTVVVINEAKIAKPIVRTVERIEKTDILQYTDEEIDLMALITMAEAEGECEEGKRLVISTILNRVGSHDFPNNVHDVIYKKNQFSSICDGRIDKCYVQNDIRELVIDECKNRTNDEVLYFTSTGYSKYGTPLFKVGNHYFSAE